MSESENKRAAMKVSAELVADWFCLPEGIAIVGCHWDRHSDAVIFHVQGDGLPDKYLCAQWDKPLDINPTYRRKEHELATLGESK